MLRYRSLALIVVVALLVGLLGGYLTSMLGDPFGLSTPPRERIKVYEINQPIEQGRQSFQLESVDSSEIRNINDYWQITYEVEGKTRIAYAKPR